MIKIEPTQPSNLIGAGIVRGMIYGCIPAYVALRSKGNAWNSLGLDVKVIAIFYLTQMVIISPAALEGTIRSIIHLCQTRFADANQKEWHQQAASAEFGAAHRLARAAALPLSGYLMIANEVRKFIEGDTSGKPLIEEYYVCRLPYETGRVTSTYVVKPLCVNGYKIAKRTAHIGYEVLDYVGFWTGVKVTTTWAARIINTGVGLAMNLLGKGK
ncbi:MAG: hypothetical protein H0U49_01225 [Parachlamydiaceae bacterium]|nr:hypothetical protein [Parachlamydiaceae bacterium]